MSGMSEGERDFEEQLRELLAEDAYTIRPSPVPYPQIRRKGVVERRRRVAVAGAVLVTLAAVPVGAFAVGGGGTGTADTATFIRDRRPAKAKRRVGGGRVRQTFMTPGPAAGVKPGNILAR